MFRCAHCGLMAVVLTLFLAATHCPVAADYVPDPNSPRDQVPDNYKWRTEHIFASPDAWENEFRLFQEQMARFDAYQGNLSESAAALHECLQLVDQLEERLSALYSYASMNSDTDQSDNEASERLGRMQILAPQYGQAVSFIEPELLAMDEAVLRSFIHENEELRIYEYAMEDLLRQKTHTLSEREEELLAMAGSVTGAPGNVYRALTGQDLIFDEIIDEQGERVRLTQSGFPRYRVARSFNVRKQAAETLFSGFRSVENTAAAALDGEVKGHILNKEARGYGSCLEASLDPDNISPAAYRMLVDTVRENLPRTLHKYVELRRKVLGVEGPLTFANLYNPMVTAAEREYSYAECRQLLQEALEPLGGEYLGHLKEGLDPDEGWVDLYPNLNKESGAYSNGSMSRTLHPFIKMNYDDTMDAAFTMAHELGHAIHSIYSRRTQPPVYGDYTSFLAEVASTCNEQLLLNHLLRGANDVDTKLLLLNQRLEKIRTTIMRQTLFSEFELRFHEYAEEGNPLTADYLNDLYAQLIGEYYGPSFAMGENDEVEWAYIPHFYLNFYVFSYATGLTSGISIASQIQKQGEPAAQRYIDGMLSAGSSAPPLELLKRGGVDLETPQPILDMLDMFEETVEEFDRVWTEEFAGS